MHAKVRFWGVHVKTCIRYFDPLTPQWISMQLASPPLHETHFSGKARKYFAEIPKLRNPSCCSGGRRGRGKGASQWKTAASCHCCKVTLGLFMASAEGRAGAAAYIHPPPSKSESKIEFQLIEGKNVWKPKLNKVVRPRPLLTFHLWLGKLWKSSGWRNFPGSHLH